MVAWISSREYGPLRLRVYDEYDSICVLCDRKVDISIPAGRPASPEIDHVHPKSRGGALRDLENLRPIHKSCNEFKADLPLDVARRNYKAKNKTSRVW